MVKVKVMEVDIPRKRIALTRRLDDTPPPVREERGVQGARGNNGGGNGPRNGRDGGGRGQGGAPRTSAPPADNALAAAFARARGKD